MFAEVLHISAYDYGRLTSFIRAYKHKLGYTFCGDVRNWISVILTFPFTLNPSSLKMWVRHINTSIVNKYLWVPNLNLGTSYTHPIYPHNKWPFNKSRVSKKVSPIEFRSSNSKVIAILLLLLLFCLWAINNC